MEESWLSPLDSPRPSERPSSPHDRVRTVDNVVIYSGGFNDSSEDLVSSVSAPVPLETAYTIPTSLSRRPSDPSFLSAWDDSLSSLSSFTAESESDFQTPTSPTWSSFSRRSSGEGDPQSTSDFPLPPHSLVGAIGALNSGADLSNSNSNPSVSLSDEDLALPSSLDDGQISNPLALPVPFDFHPGTSAETIRPSPSQLMELRLSERLSSEGLFSQRSRSSSRSSSDTSPPCTRPVTPDPSECSYISTEESDEQDDEDDTPYGQDLKLEGDKVDNDHQDASEAETVYDRQSLVMSRPGSSDVKGDLSVTGSEIPEDGEGSSSGNYGGGTYSGASSSGYGHGNFGGRFPGTRKSTGGASGSGDGRDGDGRRPSRPSMPLHGIEEDDDTDSAEEHGQDETSPNLRRHATPSRKESSDEDDVPLARSIPTALKAQKTIRKKVREENVQRRQERAMRMQAKMKNVSGSPQSPGLTNTAFQHEKPKTHRSAFGVDDLTKKLMNVQASMTGSNSQELHRSGSKSPHRHTQELGPSLMSRRPSQELPQPLPPVSPNPIHETFQKPTLRPMRSFHRPARALQPDTHEPLPSLRSGIPSSRSMRRPQTGDPINQPSTPTFSAFSLQRSKSTKQLSQARLQDEDHGSPGRSSVTRPSAEVSTDSQVHWSEKAAALPPVPPIPTYDMLMRQKSGEAWQQQVFLGDMQRSTVVEIGITTSAQDVIDAIGSRGEMDSCDPPGNGGKGWMLFELAQDFGMGMFLFRNVIVHQLDMSVHRTTDSVFRSPCGYQSLLE